MRRSMGLILCLFLLAGCAMPLTIDTAPLTAPDTSTIVTFERGRGGILAAPGYRLIFYGDGTVVYEGEGMSVAQGRHTTRIDPVLIDEMVYELGRMDFLDRADLPGLEDVLGTEPVDPIHTGPLKGLFPIQEAGLLEPASAIGLKIGDRSKAAFLGFNSPEGMRDLAFKIYEVAIDAGWVPAHHVAEPPSPLPTPARGGNR